MGNEMGNNNTTGVLQESDDATTEVQEKSLQQTVRYDDEEGENHAVPASENVNIDEKGIVLASNDSNGTGYDHVPDKSSNEGELNVKETDSPTSNHKNDKSVFEAVNNEGSEIRSNSEKPTEPVSASDENNLEKISFSKDDATSEAQEKSLQKPVPENDSKGESRVVPESVNKNIVGEETVLTSEDSHETGDDCARSKASAAEETNVTKADPPVENDKNEMRIHEDSEIKSTSLAKELEDHEKSIERVPISNEDHLETNNQLQKQASFGKAEEDGMLESCVTTSQLQNSESQVLMETAFEESKLTEIHADQSEKVSRNSEIKLDGDLGSSIENNPVKENGHHIDTYLTNMDETIVSGTDLDEEKKDELSATNMTSQKSEMQFEEKSGGNEGEFMSTTIISLNSASDDADKCDGTSINDVKCRENNRLELHQEVMANSQNSFVEDLPEDKCMVLTEETKLVKKGSETEGNKQDQKNAESNEELLMQSITDETNVSDSEFFLSPEGKNEDKNEPDSNSCDLSGNKDFQKQENVSDSGNSIVASEENSREPEGENVNVAELGMLPPELCISCHGGNADGEKEFMTTEEEKEEIKHKPEAASLNEEEIRKSENIETLKFQPLPVLSVPSTPVSLIHRQDSQQETAVLSNGSQSSSNSTLELKPESCSKLPNTKPTIIHGRNLTVDFLSSAIEIALEKRPMPVAVNSVSANPEPVLEAQSSSSSQQSVDRYDVEASLQAKDNFAEAAESVARSSTESNPNGFNAQIRKSPSFSLDLREEERSGESDRTPLLYQDKTTTKQSLENQTKEVKEKVITLERTDSEKSRTPFLGFLKQDEEEQIAETPKKQQNQDPAKNSTKELSPNPSKLKEKHNKRRSSLFTNCMCCTTVIN